MFNGKETAIQGLALCWVCGDAVVSGHRKMNCKMCQGQIVTMNAIYDIKREDVSGDD
jgi:hypothetical protein